MSRRQPMAQPQGCPWCARQAGPWCFSCVFGRFFAWGRRRASCNWYFWQAVLSAGFGSTGLEGLKSSLKPAQTPLAGSARLCSCRGLGGRVTKPLLSLAHPPCRGVRVGDAGGDRAAPPLGTADHLEWWGLSIPPMHDCWT